MTRAAGPARIVTIMVLAAAVLLPALLLLVLTLHDRGHRREGASRAAELAAARAAEPARLAIQAALGALDRAEDLTGPLSWAQLQARRGALQGEFRRIVQATPGLVALLLLRPDGRVALAAPAEPGGGEDLAGLGALRALREGAHEAAFDAVPADVVGPSAALLVLRGRTAAGRPVEGALVAALDPAAMLATPRGHALDGARIALLRQDGAVLLHAGEGESVAPTLPADGPLMAALPGAAGGTLVADPFRRGAPQIVAWQRLGAHPVHLVVAAPMSLADAGWLPGMLLNLGLTLPIGVGILVVALRVWRSDRRDAETLMRLEANAAELRAEIARREAAEESLRNAQRLEGLGRLTGGVAHDFNNLLTAILGTARSLERHLGPQADDRTKRLLAAAVAAVDRGARLNASLLAFARRQPLTLANLDANALLRDFLPLLRRALDETMKVELALDEKLPTCRADAVQLEAALLNLAVNARDAMPRGGVLRIATRRAWLQEQALAGNPEAQPGPYVAVEMRDTGEGMSPTVRERAFEPFFTTKARGQGTGLGLSQVFGFVRQIGGHVAIQSAEKRGTTVTLYLPLGSAVEPPVSGTLPPAPAASPHAGVGCTVLVVEDEPAVRAVAVDMLQDAGYAVLAAPDGPTALALLREGAQADILFSDVVMPGGMTGFDLAREARRLRPSIGVLLASGYAAEALAQHGGAEEFELIGKPYDSEGVLTRLAAQRSRPPRPASAA
ncbi:ATP-binding protein [Roseomonas sp. HF4]|uniref:ATP-binding protein n=1 Tax=Roseomonas sp. HF4 TaxID=2562313 RepID=UPI0010C11EF2|nr:ATP-binding protein [Roseomonas sp. HF4]